MIRFNFTCLHSPPEDRRKPQYIEFGIDGFWDENRITELSKTKLDSKTYVGNFHSPAFTS